MPQNSLEGHADLGFDSEFNQLHFLILEMGGLVLEQTKNAIDSVFSLNSAELVTIFSRELEVDRMEIDLDERIISLISRRSLLARDLRVTMAFSNIITDLERAGDEACRIANYSQNISERAQITPSKDLIRDIRSMGTLTLNLLEKAITAFDSLDSNLAERLIRDEQELDNEFKSSLRRLTTFVLEDARNVGHIVDITLVLRSLERIGNYAQNVGDNIIYLVQGIDVRKQADEECSKNLS